MKKEQYKKYFDNKKVTVMGLGLLGRGIGDTLFLAKSGTDLIVTDMKTEKELESSKESLKEFNNIVYHFGVHELKDFEDRDFILKAAGVPYDSEFIIHAENNNVPVYMSAALLSHIVMEQLPEVVIIGVTGTRGKSTTTELIAHILRTNNSRVHLGGNIRGVANLPILDEIEDGDFLVLELDSWQLQGFRDMGISPHIAVFTSFMNDHMNYYKGDRELYFKDKSAIYTNQKDGDILIASNSVEKEIHSRDKKIEVLVPEENNFDSKLIGKHNQELISIAYEVAAQCGLDDESIRESVKIFKGVEGRLQDLGTIKGVRVYNDNNATTEDATIAAIDSVFEKYNKKPIVILGGTDKGLPVEDLEKKIVEKAKEVVYLSGTGTDRIKNEKKYEFEKLEDCVRKTFELAKEGDIIIFSPAFASFSKYFKNEYERNDEFLKIVEEYK